jgi:chromosome segregation ATPase
MNRDTISPELMDLLRSYLRRGNSLNWLDWLPLAELAHDAPEQFIETFNTLDSLEKRSDFINLLKQQDSGPLADSLLITLAKYALLITDEQARDFVIEDAPDAVARTARRVKAMENHSSSLGEQADWTKERLAKGFAAADEILRLEGQLAKLREQEHSKEGFDEIHALEREIVRLETYRRTFAGYNMTERSNYRDDLVKETERLRAEKETMQQAIASLLVERDAANQQLGEADRNRNNAEAELRAIGESRSEIDAEITRLNGTIASERQSISNKQADCARLQGEVAALEENQKKAEQLIREVRGKLELLRDQAQAADRGDVEEKIRELYGMLPNDLADQQAAVRR